MSVSCSTGAGVGQIMLNRPDRMNSIDTGLATDLRHAVIAFGEDPSVNVILIRGAGGNFCAGGDFDEVARLRDMGEQALTGLFSVFRSACDAIATVEIPVVAAVEGAAAAGGFELMQAADIVLVRDDAAIADSHVKFGMIPGGGSTARLPRVVGRQQAMGLLLSGDRISGSDAVAMGLAYRAYPTGEFDDAVRRFAAVLAGRSREAVVAIKRLVCSGIDRPLTDALDAEMDAVVRHILGPAGAKSVEEFRTRHDTEVRA